MPYGKVQNRAHRWPTPGRGLSVWTRTRPLGVDPDKAEWE